MHYVCTYYERVGNAHSGGVEIPELKALNNGSQKWLEKWQ